MDENKPQPLIIQPYHPREITELTSPKGPSSGIWPAVLLFSILSIALSTTALLAEENTDIIEERVAMERAQDDALKEAQRIARERAQAFADIAIDAQGAIVYDIASEKALYERNADLKLPLASITKVMTALVASEELSEQDTVTVTYDDLLMDGYYGLYPGERWSLGSIRDFTLVLSANDGASALASVVGTQLTVRKATSDTAAPKQAFVQRMNDRALDLGMNDTVFYNETGLDESGTLSGAYGTARDVAKLLSYVIRNRKSMLEPTTFEYVTVSSLDGISHVATNTNERVQDIPQLLASKTGFTDLAGGTLAVAYDSGIETPIVIVVLGSTKEGRFDDVSTLARAAQKYVTVR